MSSEQRTETLGPRQRLVFPLDVPDWESARSLVDALKESVGYFKVGLELFYSSGPDCIRELRKITGDRAGVFLDLKLHDIPATVGRAMAVIDRLGADLVTVHAGDGQAIIRAAKKSAKQSKILAVTVLTSVDLKGKPGAGPQILPSPGTGPAAGPSGQGSRLRRPGLFRGRSRPGAAGTGPRAPYRHPGHPAGLVPGGGRRPEKNRHPGFGHQGRIRSTGGGASHSRRGRPGRSRGQGNGRDRGCFEMIAPHPLTGCLASSVALGCFT